MGTATKPAKDLPEDLSAILEGHQLWLETKGSAGEKAVLRGRDLSGENFQGKTLDQADLSQADLREANLADACLSGAQLQGANLAGAKLRDAKLVGADLRDAKGLLPAQLAGTDLSRAKLPAETAGFEVLGAITEVSKTGRTLFMSMILGCLYCLLTLATTTDAQLLTSTTKTELPFVGVQIPAGQFFVVAPLLLLCLYFYFHFYTQALWENLAKLPAIFPDGIAVHKKVYPWLLSHRVQAAFKRLPAPPLLSKVWGLISLFLAWWSVPFVIGLIWLRYLRCRDWNVTIIHIVVLAVGMALAWSLSRLAVQTLEGRERTAKSLWKDAGLLARIGAGVLLAVFLAVFSLGAFEGVPPGSMVTADSSVDDSPPANGGADPSVTRNVESVPPRDKTQEATNSSSTSNDGAEAGSSVDPCPPEKAEKGAIAVTGDVPKWIAWIPASLRSFAASRVPKVLSWLSLEPFANLEKEELSVKPPNWTGKHEEFINVTGVEFSERRLPYVQAREAFLMKANLARAKLQRGDFSEADLREAHLENACLQHAIFEKADLRGANLERACLRKASLQEATLRFAHLNEANLEEANLRYAFLQYADLIGANLTGADLYEADLEEANFSGASGLTKEQICEARNWEKAVYDEEFLKDLKCL